ncbi:MAG: hypothetical protein RSG23_02780 [Gordonibacter sp.]|uniref:hypothetical protein n=2 Tax=Gordonibacter sp. TaxID=1968902 RepID=UPI002FCCA8DC
MAKGAGIPDARIQRMVSPEDRARQFMPFAALKGYYDLVRQRERVPEPRRELPEEEAVRLSAQVATLCKGDMVEATYYDGETYVVAEGMVAQVDEAYRTLTVVKRCIAFDDLWGIEVVRAGA